MTKAILVTGGAGYIGSHTCKLLHEKGFKPIVLDNLVYGHRSFVKWGPFYEGDISDGPLLDTIFEAHFPQAVIHFAAFAYVGESVTDPAKYYLNNVGGTLSILEAMRRHDCRKIVFSSSCATYGRPDALPITESQSQSPINPYGMSKLMVEKILQDYDSAYGILHGALRYFNAAGADPDTEIGEDHTPETHLIPLVLEAVQGKREAIEVYGTDYETVDGTAVRDYIHVTDLANAHVRVLDFLETTGRSDQFNLGTGTGNSVQQVIDTVERVCGKSVPVKYGPRRAGDPSVLVADAVRAETELGWKPDCSDIETIIETAWKWHQKMS